MGGIKDLFGQGAKGIIEGVGGVVDKFVQTPEEKAAMKAELEKEISKRWVADSQADSWLSKNVRPLTLISLLVVFFILLFTDGNVGDFKVQPAYLPIYQSLLVTAVGGYFVVRTFDKRGKVK